MTQIEYKAYRIYKESSTSTQDKKVLEETFTRSFFNKKITDIIESIEDIYSYLGFERILPFPNPVNKQQNSLNAVYDIQNISLVLNEGWVEDWLDTDQYKYYPYFRKEELSGWVVVGRVCGSYFAMLGFGCYFKTSELALFAGNTFLDIYKKYLPE